MNLTGEAGGYFTHVRIALGMVTRIVVASTRRVRDDVTVALVDVTDLLHEGWWVVSSVNASDTYTWHPTWESAAESMSNRFTITADMIPHEEWESVLHYTRLAIMQFKEEDRG